MYRAGVNENPAHPDQYDPDTPDGIFYIVINLVYIKTRLIVEHP